MPDADDQLYGLPLEEFIAARDKTAREVRKGGDRESAARVAKLPKPSPAAWAANQVAREQPDLVSALLDAGAALRAAQDAAMSGGGAKGLREATLAERRAVDEVMTAAVSLRPAGKPLSQAMAERLRTTLHAAAGDASLRTALAAGRLVSEAQAGGAWPFALDPGTPDDALPTETAEKGAGKRGGAKKAGAAKGRAKQADDENPEAKAAAREAEEREQAEREARKALAAELREARGSLKVRERVANGAEEDADEARTALQDAKDALDAAQAEAESAERVLAEARKERDQARDDVARLEERLD